MLHSEGFSQTVLSVIMNSSEISFSALNASMKLLVTEKLKAVSRMAVPRGSNSFQSKLSSPAIPTAAD